MVSSNFKKAAVLLAGIVSILPTMVMAQTGVKVVNGYKLSECSLFQGTQDYSINYCDPKQIAILDSFVKKDPDFGKNSVLVKLWNKQANYWEFMAVNTKTKQVHLFGYGLRTDADDGKNIPYRLLKVENTYNHLCSKDTGLVYEGYVDKPSFEDSDADVDYCTRYDDAKGFLGSTEVDSRDGAVLGEAWWLQ